MKAYLVYQGGIANVFKVDEFWPLRDRVGAERLLQAAFCSCEHFARGLIAAGWQVKTAVCNVAGDCALHSWFDDMDAIENAPFCDKFVIFGKK